MATNAKPSPDLSNVIQRGIKRTLPCRITEAEFNQIAKQRVDKEALREQVVADFDRLKSKHKASIEEFDAEIRQAGKELHTGEQDRIVICTSLFRRADDGAGWVDVMRTDTGEVIEQRPCTPAEAQRFLPGVEGSAPSDGPILDIDLLAQEAEEGDDDEDEPDGLVPFVPHPGVAKRRKAGGK